MVEVRQAGPEDVACVAALQAACFPPPFPTELLWRAEHIERHLAVFPSGQFVAVSEGSVIGSASALIVSENCWNAHLPFEATTGGFFFNSHDPNGTTLFGADISIHPKNRGQGVGRALYEARFELVRAWRLRRYGTACRIPDYARAVNESRIASQEEYCDAVVRGDLTDRTLTPLLRYGLRYQGVTHGHMEDEESGDAAAVLEWTP